MLQVKNLVKAQQVVMIFKTKLRVIFITKLKQHDEQNKKNYNTYIYK